MYPPQCVIEVKKFRGLNEAIIKPTTRIEANFVGKTLFYLTEAVILYMMLYKISDFKNFAKFIRKHLCWSLFFKK